MYNYTLQDYLNHESTSFDKSEFYKGQIFALPGTTDNHSLINLNLASELRACNKTSKQNCYIYMNDVQLHIPLCQLNTYPDLMAVCGEPKYYKGREHYIILNPNLIVEISSKSTRKFDKETKLPCYLTIDTVKTVVLIDQYTKNVEVYTKGKTTELKTYTEGKFKILGCEIDVDDLYYQVKFVK